MSIININGIAIQFDTAVDDGIYPIDNGVMVESRNLSFNDVLVYFSKQGFPDDFVQEIRSGHIGNMRLYSDTIMCSVLIRGCRSSYKIEHIRRITSVNVPNNEIIIGAFDSIDDALNHLEDFVQRVQYFKVSDTTHMFLPNEENPKFVFRIRDSDPVLLTMSWYSGEAINFEPMPCPRGTSPQRCVRTKYNYCSIDVINRESFLPLISPDEFFMLVSNRSYIGGTFFNNGVRFTITDSGHIHIDVSFDFDSVIGILEYYMNKAIMRVAQSDINCRNYFKVVRYFDSLTAKLYWISNFDQCFAVNNINNFEFLVCDDKVPFVIIPFRGVWWLVAFSDILQECTVITNIIEIFFNTPTNMIDEVVEDLSNYLSRYQNRQEENSDDGFLGKPLDESFGELSDQSYDERRSGSAICLDEIFADEI